MGGWVGPGEEGFEVAVRLTAGLGPDGDLGASKARRRSSGVPTYRTAWGQNPGIPMLERYHSRRTRRMSPGSSAGASAAICAGVTRARPWGASRVSPIHSAIPACTGKQLAKAARWTTWRAFATVMTWPRPAP